VGRRAGMGVIGVMGVMGVMEKDLLLYRLPIYLIALCTVADIL
jgi:hypothetical protein